MRSPRGLLASIILLLTVPVALGVAIATGGGAEPIVHFGIGIGSLVLAAAAFDFGLPRLVAWFGAAVAAAFGSIFVLQGVADATGIDALHRLAFDVLGQQIERTLPDVLFGWFVVVVVLAREGRTRTFGLVGMALTIGIEVVVRLGPVVGFQVTDPKLHLLIPFVWLLVESAKQATAGRSPAPRSPELLASPS